MVEKKLNNAFRGYKKADVHAYFEELDKEMKTKIAMYEQCLSNSMKEATEKSAEYERALMGKDSRIDELISAKVSCEKTLGDAQHTIEELTQKLNNALGDVETLKATLNSEQEQKELLNEKIRELEVERGLISTTLLKAEERADELVSSARKKADLILDDASKLAGDKLQVAEDEYKKLVKSSDDFKRKVIISRQNLIAAMEAYKKALDDALAD